MKYERENNFPKFSKRIGYWTAVLWFLVFAGAIAFGVKMKPSDDTHLTGIVEPAEHAAKLASGYEITNLLFEAATHLAEERGLVYTTLMEGVPITPDLEKRISNRRATSDRAMDQAVSLAADTIKMPRQGRVLKVIGQQRSRLNELRDTVDAWKPAEQRKSDARLAARWFASTSRLIATAEDLLIVVQHRLRGKDPVVDMNLKLQHLAWVMSEFAARERGLMSGAIAENRTAHQDTDWTRAAVFRRFNNAWNKARTLTAHRDTPTDIRSVMNEIEKAAIRDLERLRDDLKRAGERHTQYPVSASTWFVQATDAIKPIVKLGRIAGDAARKRSTAPRG